MHFSARGIVIEVQGCQKVAAQAGCRRTRKENMQIILLLHSLLLQAFLFVVFEKKKKKTPHGSTGEPFHLQVPANCSIPVAGLHHELQAILSCGWELMRTPLSAVPHTSSRSCEKTAETVEDFLRRDLIGANTTHRCTRHCTALPIKRENYLVSKQILDRKLTS